MISSAKAVAALSVGLLALLANRRSASASSAAPGASSDYITEPARVRRVQEQLTALGYPTGWDAGAVNVPTLASLNQFLQDLGQPAVGGITPRAEALVLRVYELEQQRAGGSSSSTPSGSSTSGGSSSSPPTVTGTVIMDPLGGAVVTDRVTISNVQRWLTALGYDTGGVDGLVGRRTLAALHSFLADEGVDSRPSSITDAVVRLVRDAYGSGHLAGAPSMVGGGATEDAPPPPSARDRRIASVLEATARRRARGRTTHRRY